VGNGISAPVLVVSKRYAHFAGAAATRTMGPPTLTHLLCTIIFGAHFLKP